MGVCVEDDKGEEEDITRQLLYRQEDSQLRIAHKQMRAIQLCLESFGDKFRNSRIRLMCDNTNCVDAYRNYGSRDLHMCRYLKGLYNYLFSMNITLDVSHQSH